MGSRTYIDGEDKRKTQGIRALMKEADEAAEAERESPRTRTAKEKAKRRLQKELFRTITPEQQRAFRAASGAVDTEFLKRFVASELLELKRRIATGEIDQSYRTDAMISRLVDQLRRLDALAYADEAHIPERVTITFARPEELGSEDVSDVPEFE